MAIQNEDDPFVMTEYGMFRHSSVIFVGCPCAHFTPSNAAKGFGLTADRLEVSGEFVERYRTPHSGDMTTMLDDIDRVEVTQATEYFQEQKRCLSWFFDTANVLLWRRHGHD
jgi:hypothetical protein